MEQGVSGLISTVVVGGLWLASRMDLGGLSGGELLDHVDGLARRQRETEVEILRGGSSACGAQRAGVDPGLAAAGTRG